MKLIIGGAYQGKLSTAKRLYNVSDEECFNCREGIDYSKKLLYNFDRYIFELTKKGISACKFIVENISKLEDKIIIMNDVSSGVVPVDYTERKWREEVGRVGVQLSKISDEVIRVFCAIPTRLK